MPDMELEAFKRELLAGKHRIHTNLQRRKQTEFLRFRSYHIKNVPQFLGFPASASGMLTFLLHPCLDVLKLRRASTN